MSRDRSRCAELGTTQTRCRLCAGSQQCDRSCGNAPSRSIRAHTNCDRWKRGRSTHARTTLAHIHQLRRSLSADGSGCAQSDTLESPLYGATDVALTSVGAPMMADTIAPTPESTDPVYPGVRVLIQNWQNDRPKRPVILIGTLSNLRNGQTWLD